MIEQQPESQASKVIADRSATDRSRAGSARPGSCGAFEDLLSDVSRQLFGVYGDDTVVYPASPAIQ